MSGPWIRVERDGADSVAIVGPVRYRGSHEDVARWLGELWVRLRARDGEPCAPPG